MGSESVGHSFAAKRASGCVECAEEEGAAQRVALWNATSDLAPEKQSRARFRTTACALRWESRAVSTLVLKMRKGFVTVTGLQVAFPRISLQQRDRLC